MYLSSECCSAENFSSIKNHFSFFPLSFPWFYCIFKTQWYKTIKMKKFIISNLIILKTKLFSFLILHVSSSWFLFYWVQDVWQIVRIVLVTRFHQSKSKFKRTNYKCLHFPVYHKDELFIFYANNYQMERYFFFSFFFFYQALLPPYFNSSQSSPIVTIIKTAAITFCFLLPHFSNKHGCVNDIAGRILTDILLKREVKSIKWS